MIDQLQKRWLFAIIPFCFLAAYIYYTLKESRLDQPHSEIEGITVHNLLDPRLASNHVYYVWCGKKEFEFQHYLSVKSVINEIRPDNILFYNENPPVMDEMYYNTWFDELREEFPFLRLMNISEKDACNESSHPNVHFIHDLLTKRGGIYVNEDTIFTQFPFALRTYNLVNGLGPDGTLGFMLSKRGYPGQRETEAFLFNQVLNSKNVQCATVKEVLENSTIPMCFHSNSGTKQFLPRDFWERDDNLGKAVRKIFYGGSDIRKPIPSTKELIPNIANMVWIGGEKMDFMFYLAVLSLIYVAEVDMVYIHGDTPPTGVYWNEIKDETKLTFKYRIPPRFVYGTIVNSFSHMSDIWRVDIMLRYGGIYMDVDAVFLRPLDDKIRSYDAVASYDWTKWHPPFPNMINFGVTIGKRNASFWHLFQESMKWYVDGDWLFNACRQPYKIKERHPELLLINPYLQVPCYEDKCHPTWWPNFHNKSIHHLNSDSIPNWRENIYAFHWTMPNPSEFQDETKLMESNTMFAEIGQYILKKARKSKM